MGDFVLHQMFVQWVGDSQSADECESDNIFIVVVHFVQQTLKEADVRIEVVGEPHFDRKEVMAVLLKFLAGGVLREEQAGEILEVVDRSRWKRVEPIRSYSF